MDTETRHQCPDCKRLTHGSRIRLRFTEPEVMDNPRCPQCAKRAGLEVLPETYHRKFWEWLRS